MLPTTIMVTFNGNEITVAQEKSTIILHSQDEWVVWQLVAAPGVTLPGNCFLMIRFADPLGPFHALRGVSSRQILSSGNKGLAATNNYPYFLYLLVDPEHPEQLVTAGPFFIENQSPVPNSSPWLHISINSFEEPPVFHPASLPLHEGDVALVTISGVPDDHLVGFWFPTDNSPQGPFPAYFMTRQSGTGILRLNGARFDSAMVGDVPYGLRIWDAAGHLVLRHDPTIDGLGRPPE